MYGYSWQASTINTFPESSAAIRPIHESGSAVLMFLGKTPVLQPKGDSIALSCRIKPSLSSEWKNTHSSQEKRMLLCRKLTVRVVFKASRSCAAAPITTHFWGKRMWIKSCKYPSHCFVYHLALHPWTSQFLSVRLYEGMNRRGGTDSVADG